MIRQTKEGWWVIDGCSHHTVWIEQSGRIDHDQSLLPRILPLIPVGGTVVDAGASIGTHCWAYLERVGHTGHVFAFEPNRLAFEALVLNCPRACCMNVALSDHLGTGTVVMDSDRNYGACRVEAGEGDVEMIALDSLCLPRVDMLKIDCEGAELAILKGALKTIQRCRPIILCEVNESALEKNGTSGQELMEFITELNYLVSNVYPSQPLEGLQWDALCRPI